MIAWPALSPDLSPVENVWGEVKRIVLTKRPRTVQHLTKVARAAWKQVTANRGYVKALYGSMRGRIASVIAEKGGKIPY